MEAKFEAREQKNGTVYVYEDGRFIGAVSLSEFPLAGFARVMRAANKEAALQAVAEAARVVVNAKNHPQHYSQLAGAMIHNPALRDALANLAAALDAAGGEG